MAKVKSRGGIDLANARILVTNDDGIHAPGLKVLERIARSLSRDVWVVAPEAEHSGSAHSLTLRRPLQVHRISARRYAISGTPTDCVLLGVHHIMRGKKPDIVLSGVNRGANLGEDITYSGTVAAAIEAALLGIPAVALSQVRRGNVVYWKTAEVHAPSVIRRIAALDWSKNRWPEGVLINVNFPNIPHDEVTGIHVGRQGRRISDVQVVQAKDPFEREVLWIGDFPDDQPEHPETDLGGIMAGAITLTPLHVDLTHTATLARMAGLFPAVVPPAARRVGKPRKKAAKR